MDWNALKTFMAVARHGHLAGAARELGVNHSTVFRRLNTFEKQLGSRLFERLNDGYQLTEAGEMLLQQGEPIAAAFDTLERNIEGQNYKPQGKIRITAPDNIAYSFLPAYLAGFQQRYPQLQLELIVSNEDFSLTKREADIAVRATDRPPEHLIGRKIKRIAWGLYTGNGSEHDTAPADLSQLAGQRLIGGEGHMSRLKPFRWLDKHYPDTQVVRCNNLVAMAAIAEAGLGVAILPDDQLRPGIRRLCAGDPAWVSELWILTHPDLRQVERIRLLIQYLYDCLCDDPRL